MARFAQFLDKLKLAERVGRDVMRTERAIAKYKERYPDWHVIRYSREIESGWDLYRLTDHKNKRFEEFQLRVEDTINDWNAGDLQKFWTGEGPPNQDVNYWKD
tara:strand:- start:196 stop:504 length:309 start_codon:yes stop_codon:yes gene_type:complete